VDGADVYVACRGDRTLVRIDARTGTVRSRRPLGAEPSALAVDPGYVWIAAGENEVMRVDR
jgi:DNA-binding beta-propeller fold protein YncE